MARPNLAYWTAEQSVRPIHRTESTAATLAAGIANLPTHKVIICAEGTYNCYFYGAPTVAEPLFLTAGIHPLELVKITGGPNSGAVTDAVAQGTAVFGYPE